MDRKQDNTRKPQPSESVLNALKTVQEGLKSMQALQMQTAEAHKKFLETQAEAGRALQNMMDSTRHLAEASLGIQTEFKPRDSDRQTALESPSMPVYADAEVASYLFELGPTDCGSVGVLQNVEVGPCSEATMHITGTPGSTVWIWFGPTTFAAPDGSDVYEYDYWIHFGWWPSATEAHTLTGVRSLFR